MCMCVYVCGGVCVYMCIISSDPYDLYVDDLNLDRVLTISLLSCFHNYTMESRCALNASGINLPRCIPVNAGQLGMMSLIPLRASSI